MKKFKQPSSEASRFRRCKLYTLMLLALPAAYAQAQSEGIYEWTGNVNNSLNGEAGNWTYVGQDPTKPNSSQAIINTNSSAAGLAPTWIADGNSMEVASGYYADVAKVGYGSNSNGALHIKKQDYDGNNSWTNAYLSQLHVGTQGGTGVVNVYTNDTYTDAGEYGRVLDVSGENVFQVGTGAGSQGTVNVLGSGKTTQMQRDYNATVSISSWSQGDHISIGADGGHGTLTVDGGSIDLRSYESKLLLGSGTGSQGTLNILGGGKASHNIYGGNVPDQDGISTLIGGDSGHGVLNISGHSAHNDAISRGVLAAVLQLGKALAAWVRFILPKVQC